MIILALLALAIGPSNLQATIFYYQYVETISILSSSVGFFLAAVFLLKIGYFGSSFQGAVLFIKICVLSGLFHFICAIALILFYATSWGVLPIIVGNLYREYGYVQFINSLFYFGLFIYFLRCLTPSVSKG
jgi:hypothetical protein